MTLQKTESFVPLTAAVKADENRGFRVTVIPQSEVARPFQTLGPAASAEAANDKKNCEPRLSLQRDGERITSVRVQCSCGQVMELACVYDEPPKAK
jgi:hypothetical protein